MSNPMKRVVIEFLITSDTLENLAADEAEMYHKLDDLVSDIDADLGWQEITHSR